jgi:hypothetical protein
MSRSKVFLLTLLLGVLSVGNAVAQSDDVYYDPKTDASRNSSSPDYQQQHDNQDLTIAITSSIMTAETDTVITLPQVNHTQTIATTAAGHITAIPIAMVLLMTTTTMTTTTTTPHVSGDTIHPDML